MLGNYFAQMTCPSLYFQERHRFVLPSRPGLLGELEILAWTTKQQTLLMDKHFCNLFHFIHRRQTKIKKIQ